MNADNRMKRVNYSVFFYTYHSYVYKWYIVKKIYVTKRYLVFKMLNLISRQLEKSLTYIENLICIDLIDCLK